MFGFETDKYIVRLLDKNNHDELIRVQKLRYEYLLKEFNDSLSGDNLDDDGYDEYSDSILVIDKSNNEIAGSYRVASKYTVKGHEYKMSKEFDISSLEEDKDGFVEAGRAVVHKDYRDGDVVTILWKALFLYAEEFNLRYIIGTVSLHGVSDTEERRRCTSMLKDKFLDNKFNVKAKKNVFEYGNIEGVSINDPSVPSLLKGYLLVLGGKVSLNGYIDYDFNSSDVFIVVDLKSLDPRTRKYILR